MKSILLIAALLFSINANAFTKKEMGEAYNKIGKTSHNEDRIEISLDLVAKMATVTNTRLVDATDEFVGLMDLFNRDNDYYARMVFREILDSQFAAESYQVLDLTYVVINEALQINEFEGSKIIAQVFDTVMDGADADANYADAFVVLGDLSSTHIDAIYTSSSVISTDIKRIRLSFKSIYQLP